MRVLLAGIKQETATFNPERSRYADFEISRSGQVREQLRETRTEIAGALSVFDTRRTLEVTTPFFANAVPGGPIEQADLDRLISDMLGSIQAAVENGTGIDGACFVLHGAMAGTREHDPEGRILTEARRVLGSVPIVASLDLHAVLTDNMISATDVLVPFHTYPHTDQFETGARTARVLLGLMDGKLNPVSARIKLPLLVRGDELLTATGLFGQAIERCREIEASKTGIAAGVIIGNPFTDVADLRSNVLVTTNGDAAYAREQARGLAGFMWRNRESFAAELTPLDEAICRAESARGLTVFSDAADATSSGAPGDSNAVLKALKESGYGGRALVPIVDAPAVERSFRAGAGAAATMALGGSLDPARHTPLSIEARVDRLYDAGFVYEDGTRERPLRAAVLTSEKITMLVTDRPVYFVGRRVFLAHGLDPAAFDLVLVKSPNGFRTHYESLASLILCVDTPGATSANLSTLPYESCPRPLYPLDAVEAGSWHVEISSSMYEKPNEQPNQ